jgi:hypothetical protein
MTDIFFVEKIGVYNQGIFWIGHNKDAGLIEAQNFADNDVDDYHEWELKQFVEIDKTKKHCYLPEHVVIATFRKKQGRKSKMKY